MKRPTRSIPLGEPLDTPDDELDELAEITPEDIEEAKADARRRMDPKGTALMEATAAKPPEEASD